MIDKFGLMLCPTRGCPKIAMAPDARCPTHEEPMIRTVVSTEAEVQRRERAAKAAAAKENDVLSDMFDSFRGR